MTAQLQGAMQRRHLKPFWEMQVAALVAERSRVRSQRTALLAQVQQLREPLDNAQFMANLSEVEFAQAHRSGGIELTPEQVRERKQSWQAEVERIEQHVEAIHEQRRLLLGELRELDKRIDAAQQTGERPLDQLVALHERQGMTVIGWKDQ
jgi:uncharacterized coiled-coil DUF342 family protein